MLHKIRHRMLSTTTHHLNCKFDVATMSLLVLKLHTLTPTASSKARQYQKRRNQVFSKYGMLSAKGSKTGTQHAADAEGIEPCLRGSKWTANPAHWPLLANEWHNAPCALQFCPHLAVGTTHGFENTIEASPKTPAECAQHLYLQRQACKHRSVRPLPLIIKCRCAQNWHTCCHHASCACAVRDCKKFFHPSDNTEGQPAESNASHR